MGSPASWKGSVGMCAHLSPSSREEGLAESSFLNPSTEPYVEVVCKLSWENNSTTNCSKC